MENNYINENTIEEVVKEVNPNKGTINNIAMFGFGMLCTVAFTNLFGFVKNKVKDAKNKKANTDDPMEDIPPIDEPAE